MNAFVQNEPIEIARLQVLAMHYGQLQRWKEYEPLSYLDIPNASIKSDAEGLFSTQLIRLML